MIDKSSKGYMSIGLLNKSFEVKKLKVLKQVSDWFRIVVAYIRYLLAERLSLYDDQVARKFSKWAPRLQVRTNAQIFDRMNPISIILVLDVFLNGRWN